jgi:hypothetical protein
VVPGLWNGEKNIPNTPMDLEAVESSDTRLETDIPNWALMFLVVQEKYLLLCVNNVVGPDGFGFYFFQK